MHSGIEPELPGIILHLLWDADLEFDVHLAVPLSHIAEAGFNDGSLDDIRRYHFAVFVLDGFHQNHLPAIVVMNDNRIRPGQFVDFCGWQPLILNQANLGRKMLTLNGLQFGGRRAALSAEQCYDNDDKEGTHHHGKGCPRAYGEHFPFVCAHILPIIGALAILLVPGLYLLE